MGTKGPNTEAEAAPINPAGTAAGEEAAPVDPPASREEATKVVIEKAAKAKPKADEIGGMSESTASALLEELRISNGRAPATPTAGVKPASKIKIRSGSMFAFLDPPEGDDK